MPIEKPERHRFMECPRCGRMNTAVDKDGRRTCRKCGFSIELDQALISQEKKPALCDLCGKYPAVGVDDSEAMCCANCLRKFRSADSTPALQHKEVVDKPFEVTMSPETYGQEKEPVMNTKELVKYLGQVAQESDRKNEVAMKNFGKEYRMLSPYEKAQVDEQVKVVGEFFPEKSETADLGEARMLATADEHKCSICGKSTEGKHRESFTDVCPQCFKRGLKQEAQTAQDENVCEDCGVALKKNANGIYYCPSCKEFMKSVKQRHPETFGRAQTADMTIEDIWANASKAQKLDLLRACGFDESWAETTNIKEMVNRGGAMIANHLKELVKLKAQKIPKHLL